MTVLLWLGKGPHDRLHRAQNHTAQGVAGLFCSVDNYLRD
ncbi:hypothetical protein J2802_004510 [Paraburkholderia caribensis]|nr:hypothetical protein [Paraburkholderia caribensis]